MTWQIAIAKDSRREDRSPMAEQKTTIRQSVGKRKCAMQGARKWIDDLQVVRYHLLPANLILVPIAERCD